MGFSEKPEFEAAKKWVIAGIQLRPSLKPVLVKKQRVSGESSDGEEECSTTPTAEESLIPARSACPPPPRKRKPARRGCSYGGAAAKEFFCPPDLETVFIRRHVA